MINAFCYIMCYNCVFMRQKSLRLMLLLKFFFKNNKTFYRVWNVFIYSKIKKNPVLSLNIINKMTNNIDVSIKGFNCMFGMQM